MTKNEIIAENTRLVEERERMLRYIDRLERERYHLRSLMMIEALDAWFADNDGEEEPDDAVCVNPADEVKVRGFRPLEYN